MKRIFTAIAILGCIAMMAHADSNTVTSVNVVGYNKTIIPPGGNFNLISVQFDAFDPTLLGVFGTNQLTAGPVPTLADIVYVFEPSSGGYQQYAQKSVDPNKQFYNTSAWGTPTNPPLVAGSGLWVQSPGMSVASNEIVIAGEVVDVQTQSVDIVSGFQILGYPYSTEIPINDTGLAAAGATAGPVPTLADKIYVWDDGVYKQYGLKFPQNVWCDVTDWGDPDGTDDVLPMGVGFWYEAINPFTWEEPIPYEDALE